jgi:ornithine carbamoyltransferase
MKRDLLTILDLTRAEIEKLLARARELKAWQREGKSHTPLLGKTLALIFDKPSTRTRVSFEAGMAQLGGTSIYLAPGQTQMARNEPIPDTARVLSRYVDGVVIRTFAQEIAEELARYSTIPVINGLTDTHHPCQVLSDLLTVQEHFPHQCLSHLKVAWVGDGNNMANSWITAALHLDFTLYLACPQGYEPDTALLQAAQKKGRRVYLTRDPKAAVADVQVINTDVWASMGQEEEAAARRQVFQPYQVNAELLQLARPEAIVLHCLPAHRGEEITAEVLDGPQSAAWDQAENRLHFQKALLEWLLGAVASSQWPVASNQ